MSLPDTALPVLLPALLLLLAPPLGAYVATILSGETPRPVRMLGALERAVLRLSGAGVRESMDWKRYALSLLAFNIAGIALLFGIFRFQQLLPFNPQGVGPMRWDTALNTAVSFVTNTNWQSYSGETGLSYAAQSLGCVVQNFLSAATGIAVAAALARGFAGRTVRELGDFRRDVVRATVFILLPLAAIFAGFLVSRGVVQNWRPAVEATTLEGAKQILPMGPAAGQVAIKMIGTNGGGFFGANAAHPFENPDAVSNFASILAMLLIPAALPFAFGRMIGDRKQGVAIFAAMMALFVVLAGALLCAEHTNPAVAHAGAGVMMEGKEARFGITGTGLFATATTATSTGAVNGEMSSLSPLAGGAALLDMLLGEVVFGGVGTGLAGMVIFAVITVFICGLMVGRTPEYLGKKIDAHDVRMAMVVVVAPCVTLLALSAIGCATGAGSADNLHAGPHGLTEILYAFGSMANNNGSAFGGVASDSLFYNLTGALAMLAGRFGTIVPMLALAGSLGAKRVTPPSAGTFPTHGALFVALLCAMVLVVGALTFFPALTPGPVLEHLVTAAGRIL